MQTLRQRKKAESRQNMLDAAKQLFIKNGYSKTTMEDIADQAGFGVATLYNYFKTKEGMFAAMAHDDMSEIKAQGETVLGDMPDDPIEGVLALLKTYLKVYDYISYAVMQEFINQIKTSGPLHDISEWSLNWQRDQVKAVLDTAKASGRMNSALDTELMSYVLIDLFIRYNQRISSNRNDKHQFSELRKIMNLVLEGWHSK
jgi:AcrR family transcriptional regulator